MERKHQGIEVFGISAEEGKYARSGCISIVIGVNSSMSRRGCALHGRAVKRT